MFRPVSVVLALGFASAGCATTAHEKMGVEDPAIATRLAGLVPGKEQSCISLRESQSTANYSETILYRVGRDLTYRADVPGCTELMHDNIMVLDLHSSQICRGDIFRLLDRTGGFQHGACVFRGFVPYRKPG